MVLKCAFAVVIGAMLLAWSGMAIADEVRPDKYRPDEFLGLDLSKALLSPKPFGPPSRFAPVQVEAKTDLAGEARSVRVERIKRPNVRVARTRLAPGHRSPLNAQAFDTRVQVWPCKSGGICNWKRQAN